MRSTGGGLWPSYRQAARRSSNRSIRIALGRCGAGWHSSMTRRSRRSTRARARSRPWRNRKPRAFQRPVDRYSIAPAAAWRSVAARALCLLIAYRGMYMTTETIPAEQNQSPPTTAPQARVRIRTRPLVIGLIGLIVLAVVARFGYTYYIDSTLYVTTDDALVDSNLVSIAPIGSGTLAIWRIK